MDSFKFNSLNYQDTSSLVEAQNNIIQDLIQDNKVQTAAEGNYAAFREKEKQRQLQQLGDIIAGIPKLKENLKAAKAKREADKEVKDLDKEAGEQEEQSRINRTGVHSTGMEGRAYDNPGYIPLTKDEVKKRKLDQEITAGIQDPNTDTGVKNVLEGAATKHNESNKLRKNTNQDVLNLSTQHVNKFAGDGLGYNMIAEHGKFKEFDDSSHNYLVEIARTPYWQKLDHEKKLLFVNNYRNQLSNYKNQASRAWVAKSSAVYKTNRQHELLDNIKSDGGSAIEEYIFKHEYYGNKKNTPQAINQLIDDLTELEKDGHVTAETYTKILRGWVVDRSSNKRKHVADLNNGLSNWIQGRQITLQSKKNEEDLKRDRNNAKNDIEQGEKEFAKLQEDGTLSTPEEEEKWRQTWLVGENGEGGAYRRNPKIAAFDSIWAPWINGLTRLDGPDHSITLERLRNDYNKGAPLDDEMYNSLPKYWKGKFQEAIKGTDEEEGSSGKSIGTGKLTFKSYFNALQKGGGWDTWVMDQMKITDINTAQSNPRFGWIVFQGKEDYVTKFEELKKIGSVRDAQAGALKFIKEKYKEYYDNPIEEGFDERIISSITEGRQDIIPRLRGKSQDDKLSVLNQPTFWAGEQVAFEELMQWSRGYGEFPQYYRQIDDNMFKDMTPREIAVHRMEIHKDRIENKKEFDNALKAIYKGVELDKKLYDSLPIDTSRLLTNHNTASRTYRAEVIEKDNPEVYETLKINDDPNAYTLTNPYILEKPGNLSEMSLLEVLNESKDKRIKSFGLYALTPKNIMNVLSKEEHINGFLNTKFDEELQTELKRRLARLAANTSNQYGALEENPNPLPNLIPEDVLTLTEAFGPQIDWSGISPNVLQEYLKELQEQELLR